MRIHQPVKKYAVNRRINTLESIDLIKNNKGFPIVLIND